MCFFTVFLYVFFFVRLTIQCVSSTSSASSVPSVFFVSDVRCASVMFIPFVPVSLLFGVMFPLIYFRFSYVFLVVVPAAAVLISLDSAISYVWNWIPTFCNVPKMTATVRIGQGRRESCVALKHLGG